MSKLINDKISDAINYVLDEISKFDAIYKATTIIKVGSQDIQLKISAIKITKQSVKILVVIYQDESNKKYLEFNLSLYNEYNELVLNITKLIVNQYIKE